MYVLIYTYKVIAYILKFYLFLINAIQYLQDFITML